MEKGNELVVKEVDFNGDTLLAVQSNENGKIYVGVKWVCTGLGLSEDQMKNERKKFQKDLVLSQGGSNLTLLTNGGNQEVLCVDLDFLPLWLAKISITPNMKEESEKLKKENGEDFITSVDKLVTYQIKAKDVLAKAFIKDNKMDEFISEYLNLNEDERAIAFFKERKERRVIEQEKILLAEQNEILQPKAESFDIFIDAKNNQRMNDVAKSLGVGRNKLFDFLRMKEVLMSDNVPYQRFCNSGYFIVRQHTIDMGGYSKNTAQTFVTPKGVDYIRKMLKEVDYNLN